MSLEFQRKQVPRRQPKSISSRLRLLIRCLMELTRHLQKIYGRCCRREDFPCASIRQKRIKLCPSRTSESRSVNVRSIGRLRKPLPHEVKTKHFESKW